MRAIVAIDQKWGIGYEGKLLQRIPEDMKFFRQMTQGKVVVMGRGTLESLPGKAPLKDRVNIVLSRDKSFEDSRVIICRSIKELSSIIKGYKSEDVFIIGGESIYGQLLPYCREAFVTKIEETYPADRYFVNLDKEKNWELVSEGDKNRYEDIEYSFLNYLNTRVLDNCMDT